jgi:hypothetical protein
MNKASLAPGLATRYRGAQPFADDEISRRTFFGRDAASNALVNQVLANRLVVVYARSGVGKSSLLNAGVMPRLREAGYQPLAVRLNDLVHGPKASLLDGVRAEAQRQDCEFVEGDARSLWSYFKTAEFWRGDVLLTPVLVIDQFEELFTLHAEEDREHFLLELGELVRGFSALGGGEQLGQAAPYLHVVITLREDYLGLLEEAADRIPQIMDSRFRLLPMVEEDALLAMSGPAAVDDPLFVTRAFQFSDELTNFLLRYLSQRTQSLTGGRKRLIEPFHLQLLCQRIEQLVDQRGSSISGDRAITLSDVGGEVAIERTLAEFYSNAVNTLDGWFVRRRVRRLCERLLISPDGRRLSLEKRELLRQAGLSEGALRTLVESRILRVDRRTGGAYYELSHDALIVPILSSRRTISLTFAWLTMALGGILAAGTISGVTIFWPNLLQDVSGGRRDFKDPLALMLVLGASAYAAQRALAYGSRTLALFRGQSGFTFPGHVAVIVFLLYFVPWTYGLSMEPLVRVVLPVLLPLVGFVLLAWPNRLLVTAGRLLTTSRLVSVTDCLRVQEAAKHFGNACISAAAVVAGLCLLSDWSNEPSAIRDQTAASASALCLGLSVKLLIASFLEQAARRRLGQLAEKPPPVPMHESAWSSPGVSRLAGGLATVMVGWSIGIVMGSSNFQALLSSAPLVAAVLAILIGTELARGRCKIQDASTLLARLLPVTLASGGLAAVPALLFLGSVLQTRNPSASEITQGFAGLIACLVAGLMAHFLLLALSLGLRGWRNTDLPSQ